MASSSSTQTPATTAPTTAPASPKIVATHADFEDSEGPMEIGSDSTESDPEDSDSDSDDDEEWEETSTSSGDDEATTSSDESASDGYATSLGLSTYHHPPPHADSDSDYYTTSHPPSHIRRASNTTTLFSSVQHYEVENNRRYHSYRSGIYILPNDDVECERLDLGYALGGRMLGGGLVWGALPASLRAEVIEEGEEGGGGREGGGVVEGGGGRMQEERKRVLDVGTGTGIWAIDFADLYPRVEVVATDLSPIQPTSIPANLSFEVDDAGSEWTYPDNHFDTIHIRNIAGSITDWRLLLSQALRCLKPNGTLHLSESYAPLPSFSSSSPSSPSSDRNEIEGEEGEEQGGYKALKKLTTEFLNLSQTAGLLYHDLASLAHTLRCVGFKDVQSERGYIPFLPPSAGFSPPPHTDTTTTKAEEASPPTKLYDDDLLRRILMIQVLKLQAFESFALRLFTQTGSYSSREVLALCEAARAEIASMSTKACSGTSNDCKEEVHLGAEVWFFWARKGRGAVGPGLEGIVE